ncbi:hypothetical protein MLD38_004509 [Melastoma candidum]|uniref:Uncharacterized protein n=1 Tax=Melastoma candidum TaxID=119954 RepID=A0ACB9S7F3_9MYRT|nr:hypothetical protein MLD38_004509 [Melastoma candidum]
MFPRIDTNHGAIGKTDPVLIPPSPPRRSSRPSSSSSLRKWHWWTCTATPRIQAWEIHEISLKPSVA